MAHFATTVIVDAAHIDALRRDVLMIARAADNVASLENIDQVTLAIRAWRKRWDTFATTVRQDLERRLHQADQPYDSKYNANPPSKGDAEYYLNRALAPMWEFDSELGRNPHTDTVLKDVYGNPWKPPEEVFEDTARFYLNHGYAASREDAVREAARYHDRRPPSTKAEAEAAAVAKWKAEATKWTRRLRDKARKAWDTLNEYVAWLGGARGGTRPLEVVHPEEEIVTIAGFRVVFRGFAESPHKDKLDAVKTGLERYRAGAAARAPLMLKMTPPIFVEWTFEPTTGDDAAGYYTPNRVTITPWAIGADIDRFVKTLAHEVGHHLFKVYLAGDAATAWSRFIRGDYQDLNLREALVVMGQVGATSIIDKSLMEADPILHLQLSTLMYEPAYKHITDWLFADRIREYLEKGGSPVVRVPIHPITGYSGKNSEEAFCEALGNLIAYGPKAVPNVVLGMLRSVLGGKMKIAARVAAAWLTRIAWAGGACNPNTLSTAWITPEGGFIPVPPRETHTTWAMAHLADDPGFLDQRYGAARYLTDTMGWVRLVNAYTLETGPRGASNRAMQTAVDTLIDCVVQRRDIDIELDTMTVELGSRTLHPTIADFVAEYGTSGQIEAMYERLMSRTAALRRPDYCGAVSFHAREATCVSDAKRVIRDRLRGLSRQERRDVERVDEALDAALVDWHDAMGKSYNRALQEMGLLDEDIKEGLVARIAARYKDKKEVPKADGSGTTTVYVYGPRQVANRHKEKAERIEGLRGRIGDLRRRVKADLKSDDPETRLTALAIALIDATYERVGNDESADNGHYGVTGWTMDHITFSKDGKRATIKYIGKSGVKHEKKIDDSNLVSALKACCGDKGKDEHILSEGEVRVKSSMVNDYLRKFDITAKDLRGFHANREMQERLRAIRRDGPELPHARKDRDAILKDEFAQALEGAAKAVGHESSTLRKQYLVPWLEDTYMKDGTIIDRLDKVASTLDGWTFTATKSITEQEDDEANRLVRSSPKLKPSRDDSKRERMHVADPDLPARDKDLSLNYKDNG